MPRRAKGLSGRNNQSCNILNDNGFVPVLNHFANLFKVVICRRPGRPWQKTLTAHEGRFLNSDLRGFDPVGIGIGATMVRELGQWGQSLGRGLGDVTRPGCIGGRKLGYCVEAVADVDVCAYVGASIHTFLPS